MDVLVAVARSESATGRALEKLAACVIDDDCDDERCDCVRRGDVMRSDLEIRREIFCDRASRSRAVVFGVSCCDPFVAKRALRVIRNRPTRRK